MAMSQPDLLSQLKKGHAKWQRKMPEHQHRAIWPRMAYSQLRPTNDLLPGSRPPSNEDPTTEPDMAPDPPDDELPTSPVNTRSLILDNDDDSGQITTGPDPVIADLILNSRHAGYQGNRYSPKTREFTFELLRTCVTPALASVRKHISLPSRQSLCRKPPEGYERSDLTDLSLITDRIRRWRSSISGKLSTSTFCPVRFACAALAFKLSIEVTPDRITGLDVCDFDFNSDLLESLPSSSESFQEFVEGHWDKLFGSAFVFHIQPLNLNFPPFVIYAQPAVDGKGRHLQVELLKSVKISFGKQRITIDAFATDGDAGCDVVHNQQSELHVREFEKPSIPRLLRNIGQFLMSCMF
jgi:hypothetical protein